MMLFAALVLLITLVAPTTLVDEDVLEPSVRNEVDHALGRVPDKIIKISDYSKDLKDFCATNDFFGTTGLARSEVAIKLVSRQDATGRWILGTNDVSALAVEILKGL